MRRMLFGLAVALLTFAGAAWADGPIVRWSSVIGVMDALNRNAIDKPANYVAGIVSASSWMATTGGRVSVNLSTGFVAIDVEGLSHADQRLGNPNVIGSAPSLPKVGVVICRATTDSGDIVRTQPFLFHEGNGHYRGFVDPALLQGCREEPERTVFLLENYAAEAQDPFGAYIAYGIGRTIQTSE
jgi:hypothetical protein